MAVRVAVSDPLPLFRHGIVAALADGGVDAESPDDLVAWARNDERRIVLLTVRTSEDWILLGDVCSARADTIVVAMLDEASTTTYVRAIRTGAAVALPRNAPPTRLRETFQAAVKGTSVLPIDVVRALASPGGDGRPEVVPTPEEVSWLRQLERGDSVASLAERSGYSERMLFRLLRKLYARIGVANRREALMRARDEGWL